MYLQEHMLKLNEKKESVEHIYNKKVQKVI